MGMHRIGISTIGDGDRLYADNLLVIPTPPTMSVDITVAGANYTIVISDFDTDTGVSAVNAVITYPLVSVTGEQHASAPAQVVITDITVPLATPAGEGQDCSWNNTVDFTWDDSTETWDCTPDGSPANAVAQLATITASYPSVTESVGPDAPMVTVTATVVDATAVGGESNTWNNTTSFTWDDPNVTWGGATV